MQRPQQLALMFLLGAFLVGGTLGFTMDRMYGDQLLARGERHASLEAFASEIELSPGQRAAFDSILDERHRVIDSLIAPVRPGIQAAKETARRQMAARLTPEQRLKFEAFLARTAGDTIIRR